MKYLTVGPSKINTETKNKLVEIINSDILSESHRGPEFKSTLEECISGLRTFLCIPDDYGIAFANSATEAMEVVAKNTIHKRSQHLVTGVFSRRLFKVFKSNNIRATQEELEDIVTGSQNSGNICLTENETTTSHQIPHKILKKIRKNNPNAFIAIDVTSSAALVQHDYKLGDYWFFSVQKGLGLPSGLGIIIYNTKKVGDLENEHTGFLRRFEKMVKNCALLKTLETPNMIAYYLLADRIKQLTKKGDIKNIHKTTLLKSEYFYKNIDKKYLIGGDYMSDTVFIIQSHPDDIASFKAALKKHNICVSDGYGKMKDHQLRIANFENNTLEEIQQVIDIIHSI